MFKRLHFQLYGNLVEYQQSIQSNNPNGYPNQDDIDAQIQREQQIAASTREGMVASQGENAPVISIGILPSGKTKNIE